MGVSDYGIDSFSLSHFKISYPTLVNWRCLRCSICCRDTPRHPRRIRLLLKEAIEISRKTGIPVEQFARKAQDQRYPYEMRKRYGSCLFLEGRYCRLYDYRPLVCRFYPFEMESDGSTLKILFAGEACPGSGRGQPLGEHFFRRLATHAIERLIQQPVLPKVRLSQRCWLSRGHPYP
ncbi:YkgJ family cysteine cluster protein [Candidatus Bathyarchaeota archaeon]|nr:YkgJ family cysteine cluster protein [Candidatus Bathyarchaeota archaeon]